ncbi:cation:proton antiporter [Oceanirhabdus sp. W0125-5]|uniref:cation:proton antiporter n=1 Tax=Oceanirhabdus sp. W0125-5 TaxID=2999116 RepID=UPI0022F32AA9|nr:cation:proton antiporter [Oceanirhabdus sp. W0125-5]WBW97863.1 cation:proton antiporter [Oceanirhabdus sp. W0125-5]
MIKSVLIILFFGFLGNKIFSKIKLPGLLGMIIAGIIVGPYALNLIDGAILDNAADIRSMALIIILLRAGLGINKETLKKVGKVSMKMASIPCLLEGGTILLITHYLLDWSFIQSGILAFIIAAVSPAVIVPSMLKLKESGRGMDKGIPVLILAGSSIDDIFAMTLFAVFMGLEKNTGVPLGKQLLAIPFEIIGGILLGCISGYMIIKIMKIFKTKFSKQDKLLILLASSFGVYILGGVIKVSGLLSIMTIGFLLLEYSKETAEEIQPSLNKIWYFAQIFLFMLIGAAVDINIAIKAGLVGLLIISIGLIARTIGVVIALMKSGLSMKEKLFCAIAYVPKATVQAAIGAKPLEAGVVGGELMLAIAVLSIIVTAPLGAIGIKISAPKLLNKVKIVNEEDIEKLSAS